MAKWILILVLSISLIGCSKSPVEKAKELYDRGAPYSNLKCGEGLLTGKGKQIVTPNGYIFEMAEAISEYDTTSPNASWSYNELTGQLFGFKIYDKPQMSELGFETKVEIMPSIVIECERIK